MSTRRELPGVGPLRAGLLGCVTGAGAAYLLLHAYVVTVIPGLVAVGVLGWTVRSKRLSAVAATLGYTCVALWFGLPAFFARDPAVTYAPSTRTWLAVVVLVGPLVLLAGRWMP